LSECNSTLLPHSLMNFLSQKLEENCTYWNQDHVLHHFFLKFLTKILYICVFRTAWVKLYRRTPRHMTFYLPMGHNLYFLLSFGQWKYIFLFLNIWSFLFDRFLTIHSAVLYDQIR
jgi:hypothetical protein